MHYIIISNDSTIYEYKTYIVRIHNFPSEVFRALLFFHDKYIYF